MLQLNTIKAQKGATHRTKRLGRGSGSGHGPTAGKGDKGQLQRSGGRVRAGFEGGQMPLYRRIPKRGFKNPNRRTIAIVNLADFDRYATQGVKEISLEGLTSAQLLKGRYDRLTVLGTGEVKGSFFVKAHKVSASAKEKIEKAGGKIELIAIPGPQPRAKKEKKAKKAAATPAKA